MHKLKAFILLIAGAAAVSCGAREIKVLDGVWRFHQGSAPAAYETDFDDSGWSGVSVPHTWNTDLLKGEGYARGDGWYRRLLEIPVSKKGKRLFLRFQGAMLTADVYLNGEKLGSHGGGYSAFAFEITDKVRFGEKNVLAVRTNNENNSKVIPVRLHLYTLFGGIYRPVELITTDEVCITPLDYASPGVYLAQENVSEKSADLTVTARLSSGSGKAETVEVVTTVLDADGKVVERLSTKQILAPEAADAVSMKTQIKNPKLWNGLKSPYLYSAVVEVKRNGQTVDSVTQPLGFRYYHVDADKGFFLNGKPYQLYGVCAHQDRAEVGTAVSPEQIEEDHALIKEIGARGVRLAHYQHADLAYTLCDQNGVIVWAEIPLNSGRPSMPAVENAKEQLIELIRQNYNHPSIFFWGIHNELDLSKEVIGGLHDLAKAEDPGRLTTGASNKFATTNGTKEGLEPLVGTDLLAFNAYAYWYNMKLFPAWTKTVRDLFPGIKIGISEYGAGGCIEQQEQHPQRPKSSGTYFPEQYQSIAHEKAWADIQQCEFLWSTFIWNMFDFSVSRLTRGVRPAMNHKGLVTYDRRIKKDAFFFYKANWSEEPVLYITSRRHTERDDAVTEIKVYSNCGNLALRVNGNALESVPGKNGTFVWKDIELKTGQNTISVEGEKEGRQLSDSCTWTLK